VRRYTPNWQNDRRQWLHSDGPDVREDEELTCGVPYLEVCLVGDEERACGGGSSSRIPLVLGVAADEARLPDT